MTEQQGDEIIKLLFGLGRGIEHNGGEKAMDDGRRPVITAILIGAAIAATIFFGISPFFWALRSWHCYWFATAPICQ